METTTDTTTSPAATVGAVYAAFGRGDMPGLMGLLHPAVDWSIDVDAPGGDRVPMFRHGIGHEAVARYFEGVAQLEMHSFDLGRLFVDGDAVVAEIHLEVTHRTSGRRAALDELHHWVVRDGQVVRYRPFLDTAAMIELFGP
ncbi:MAG: nuclear transport factor 2 family protein [Microthrixaceae bacterium]|nr:nuclear transport factor 2 family protein [Microthrixaceae bacterium]